ncbi:MAG: hypothetical protein ACYCOU_23305 [Sulfobacillus sp.]
MATTDWCGRWYAENRVVGRLLCHHGWLVGFVLALISGHTYYERFGFVPKDREEWIAYYQHLAEMRRLTKEDLPPRLSGTLWEMFGSDFAYAPMCAPLPTLVRQLVDAVINIMEWVLYL